MNNLKDTAEKILTKNLKKAVEQKRKEQQTRDEEYIRREQLKDKWRGI